MLDRVRFGEKTNKTISNFILLLVLLTIFKPFNASLWPTIDTALKCCKFVFALFLIIFLLCRSKMSKFLLTSILLVLINLLSTLINKGDFSDIQSWLSIIMIGIAFELAAKNNNLISFLKIIKLIFSLWIILNTITIFMGGPLFASTPYNYPTYFLGSDNYFAFIYIVMIGFISAIDRIYNKKFSKSTFFLWGLVLIGEIYTFTVAGLAAIIFMVVMFLAMNRIDIKKIINVKVIFTLITLFIISVAFLHVEKIFAPILLSLGKGTNLSYRSVIWPLAVKMFFEKPILGFGQQTSQFFAQHFIGASHCHNVVLEILVTSGIVGGILFYKYISYSAKKLKGAYKGNHLTILLITLSTYFVCGVFDFYYSLIYLYALVDFIYYIDTLPDQENKSALPC